MCQLFLLGNLFAAIVKFSANAWTLATSLQPHSRSMSSQHVTSRLEGNKKMLFRTISCASQCHLAFHTSGSNTHMGWWVMTTCWMVGVWGAGERSSPRTWICQAQRRSLRDRPRLPGPRWDNQGKWQDQLAKEYHAHCSPSWLSYVLGRLVLRTGRRLLKVPQKTKYRVDEMGQ